MPRIRTIKPEFWESEKVGKLSPLGRLVFLGLISLADDDGRGRSGVRFLKSRLFPYDHQNVTRRVPEYLQEISKIGLAKFYTDSEGYAYYWIPGFKDNQRIEKPRPSKLPDPSNSRNVPGKVPVGMDQGMEWNGIGMEGKRKEPSAKPPASSPRQEIIRQLLKKAKQAKIPNKLETIRIYLDAWIERSDSREVERVLMLPDIRGLNIIQIDKAWFNGDKVPVRSIREKLNSIQARERMDGNHEAL